MNTFKAAVLENLGKPLIIKELKIPKLEFGQVLIKLKYSGVCRSQLMEVKGSRGEDKYLPHLLGHEGMGVVFGVGPGVTKVNIGDEVIIGWIKGIGIDSQNPIFLCENNIIINSGGATTFSELSIVSENRVYLKPKELEDHTAVLFGCAMLTGAGLVFNELTPEKNNSVLLLGLGGVGLSVLISLFVINPKRIIVADSSAEKRKLALSLGVQLVFDSTSENFLDKIINLSNGGVDVAYDCAGSTESIETAFQCIKAPGGQLIFASHPNSGEKIKLDPFDLIRGKTIRGSWGGNSLPDRDIPKFAKLLGKQLSNLDNLLGKRYCLNDINSALESLDNGENLRPIIDMQI